MALQPYLTLAEAKAWLRVTASDQDTDVQAAISAATGAVINYLGYDASLGLDTETVFGKRSAYLFPTRKRIAGVTSCVDTVTGQTIACTYDKQAVRRIDGAFFETERGFTLTYTAGYPPEGDEFAAVKLATKIALQACWGAAILDPNLTGESFNGVFSGGYTPLGPGALPQGARSLLDHLRRVY